MVLGVTGSRVQLTVKMPPVPPPALVPSTPPSPFRPNVPQLHDSRNQSDTLHEVMWNTTTENRSMKLSRLKKQTSCVELYPKPAPTLRHSASFERFPEHYSWLKPSLSMGSGVACFAPPMPLSQDRIASRRARFSGVPNPIPRRSASVLYA